jgi:hypothetical protein
MTHYSFAIALLNASGDGSSGLNPWQSGTLEIDDSHAPAISGQLTLPGDLSEPIRIDGEIVDGGTQATTFTAKGQGGRAMVELSLAYGSDQMVYTGTYLAGMANLLDSGQEWLFYVVQGLCPQAPPGVAEAANREG